MSDDAAATTSWWTLPARRPWRTLAIALVVTAIAAAAAVRLEPVVSLQRLIGSDDAAAAALDDIAERFAVTDDLLLVARWPATGGAADAPRDGLLRFARRLERELAKIPGGDGMIRRVRYGLDEGDDEQRFVRDVLVPDGVWYLDDDAFAELERRLTPAGMDEQLRRNEVLLATPGPAAAEIARRLVEDPLRLRELLAGAVGDVLPASPSAAGEGGFFGRDGRSLLVRITGARPASDLELAAALVAAVRAAADRAAAADDVTVELTGAYAIAARAAASIRADMIRSVTGSIVLMQLLFLVAYRPVLSFALAFAPAAIGILVGFGIYAATARGITPATAVIGAILAGLGIDYCIHLLSHHQRRMESGASPRQAAIASVAALAAPIGVALSTSLVGLLAISRSSVRSLEDFALLAALGLGGAAVAALAVLPALLVTCGGRRGGERLRLDGVVHLVARRPRGLLAAGAVAWVAAALTLVARPGPVLPIDADLGNMHPRPNRPLELQAALAGRFDVPAETLLLRLAAADDDALVRAAHAVRTRVRAASLPDGERARVYGLSSLLPDPAGAAARRARLAAIDVDAAVAGFRAAVERSAFDVDAFDGFAAFLRRFLTAPRPPGVATLREYPELAATVLPRVEAAGAPATAISLVMLDEALDDERERAAVIGALRGALAATPSATLTGVSVLGHDMQAHVRDDLARLLALAAVAVVLILAIFLRRPADVLLTLLPTAFGLTCALLAVAVTGGGLNMINLIGLPLLAGIGVDDGVFLVGLARRQRRDGDDGLPGRDLAASLHAITVTSATTGVAFASLTLTETPAIRSLGLVTAAGIAGCWLATVFLLLPALLLRAGRSPAGSGAP